MLTAGDDPQALESALRLGLAAGLPDEELLPGMEKLCELESAQKAEAERMAERRREAEAEAAKQAAEEAAELALRQRKLPKDGEVVLLSGLDKGLGPFGHGELDLKKHNGRFGRVVEQPTPSNRYLLRVAYDEMPANPESRQLVCVHTGTRCTDPDQRHGTWLAVPLQCVEQH